MILPPMEYREMMCIINQLLKDVKKYKEAYEILEGTICGYRIGGKDLEKARKIIGENK